MYQQLHSLSLEKQVETLTEHLVSFNSINGTTGEVRIIDELYHILKSFLIFKSILNIYGFKMRQMIQLAGKTYLHS